MKILLLKIDLFEDCSLCPVGPQLTTSSQLGQTHRSLGPRIHRDGRQRHGSPRLPMKQMRSIHWADLRRREPSPPISVNWRPSSLRCGWRTQAERRCAPYNRVQLTYLRTTLLGSFTTPSGLIGPNAAY